MNARILLALLVLSGPAAAQEPLRFLARPAVTWEGDAVVFSYREDVSTIKYGQIKGWRWDFDGDVGDRFDATDPGWDEVKEVGDFDLATGKEITPRDITTTWYATFDETRATAGVLNVTPRLVLVTTSNQEIHNTVAGVTENTVGPSGVAPDPDRELSIKSRSAANADLTVDFSASPRLAPAGATVRLYSSVKFADKVTGTIGSYQWDLDGDGVFGENADELAANPVVTFATDGARDIGLRVQYSLTGTAGTRSSPPEVKKDYIRIATVADDLVLGRAYRRGFPDTLAWDDIISAYQALGPGGNRYVYFDHLQQAFFNQQFQMTPGTPAANDPQNRRELAEIVNELMQGQTLIANQRLIEALRIKYPRLAADVDPEDLADRLNPPAGARTETAAIDQALLDYQLPIYHAATSIQLYGTDILRTMAPEGQEPYPQFPQYLTFLDPSLSQGPIPIKNEYWQLTTALDRQALGRVEKAKKLYRLSAQESAALTEAKAEAKMCGSHAYLGMALLAAAQTPDQFQLNEGNSLLAHIKNARDLFDRINAGLNPLGNDGSFIPNESFAAIFQDAVEAVGDAREAEVLARQEERTWDSYQAELRNEHLAQRNNYLTPLKNLTSIDPALYNNLNTAADQRDYRAVVQGRLQALLADYPNANAAILGELGSYVISVLDAAQGVQMAVNERDATLKRIDIAKWQNVTVQSINQNATSRQRANDVLFAAANFYLNNIIIAGVANGGTLLSAVGRVLELEARQAEREIQKWQQASVSDVNLAAEVQNMLIQIENQNLAIIRSNNQLNQAQLALDNQLARMDRLIEDLSHTRETAADLYFQDPSFRVVVSQAMRRAEGELDYAVDRLYRLAKTLQYYWTEGYQNPIVAPVNSQEPASLENPLFDKFTQTDSLFFIRGADEAKDYLDALKAWDSKLRRINVVSVRGPNFSGPISAEPISMRETILNLAPDPTRGYTLEQSIRDFRNYLEGRRIENFYNANNRSLEIPFATTIEDNRFFPATGSRWNMRIHSIAVDIYSESGFSNKQIAEIDLVQSGVVSLRRFFANPPLADDVLKLSQNVDDINRTAFAVAFPARINGATGGRPLTEFDNLGLRGRPVAATSWILRINTENPSNTQIDFSKIKDIVVRFTYTFGNPEEFDGF